MRQARGTHPARRAPVQISLEREVPRNGNRAEAKHSGKVRARPLPAQALARLRVLPHEIELTIAVEIGRPTNLPVQRSRTELRGLSFLFGGLSGLNVHGAVSIGEASRTITGGCATYTSKVSADQASTETNSAPWLRVWPANRSSGGGRG